jgi:hypothetical protein
MIETMSKKIQKLKLKTNVFFALTLCSYLAGACQHTNKDSDITGSDSDSENTSAEDATDLPHPQAANEFATRIFVSTTTQHPQEKINECIEQVSAIGRDSFNQDDMVKAVFSSQAIFAQNLPLYHSCFYQLSARLDNRLAQGGPLVTELSGEFFETIQAMWIMAKALDRVTGKKVYYTYLKQRYVQISRDVFGRQVAPLGDGFDEKRKPGENIKQSDNKAADPYK